AARGQAELLTGEVESKESILDRYVGYREDIARRKAENQKTLTDPAAGPAAKAQAALDDAGMAKAEAEGTLYQLTDKNPVESLINRAGSMLDDLGERERVIKELRKLERRYPPQTNRYLAPNGKPSLLLETLGEEKGREAWYAVRTASFKEWFGDWERAARIEGIENKIPVEIQTGEPINQKAAEDIARSFKVLKNVDGRIAALPINTIGKLFGHKNYDFSRIIESIPGLYETAILGWSEPEVVKEGHKAHPNIKAYHHYLNKFTDGSGEYFIRITVNEENSKPGKTGKNLVHSAAISDIAIYEKGDHPQRIRVISPGEVSPSPFFIDKKLQQFLDSVNPSEVSQVRDANGEPLAVFHGTNAEFDVFDGTLAGKNFEAGERGYFFTNYTKETKTALYGGGEKTYHYGAASYADEMQRRYGGKYNVMGLFLNIRNPMVIKENSDGAGILSLLEDWRGIKKGLYEDADKNGNDGIIAIDTDSPLSNGEYEAIYNIFSPTQVKSATDNAGTYGSENPSILFQTYEELLEDAARFESAAAFEEAYRNPRTRPDDAYISTEADRKWYEIFWRDARTAAGLTEERAPSAPEQGDRAFLKDINREKLRDVVIELDKKLHAGQKEPVAPEAGEDRTAYDKEMAEYQKAQELQARINRELPHRQAWVGVAAKVANGGELSVDDYNTLRGYLRNTPRDYRALFADLMNRREWGLNLTEMKDGIPDTPLSAPRLEKPDDMDVKNRKRLAEAIGDADPELAKGIREGTVTVDDPRIRAFEKGLDAGIKQAEETIAAVEAEIAEDARKFSDRVKKEALKLYREFKEAEEKYQARTTELAKKIQRSEDLTGRYRQEDRLLLTDFDSARLAFDDFVAANNLRAEIREELARIDARYAERQRLRDLQKKRQAVREVKRIEESLIKRIVRSISRKGKGGKRELTVAYDEARVITIIQSFFEPSLLAGVNHRLGTIRGPALREIYMKWKTDAE
ncbi:MAG: hypothetical protein LBG08_01890, partial [Spirochaetaceae bacterium]|nr:hypothetical protein [Spirochaetaceae bacterium]